MTETVLRGETRMFAPRDARWLGERRRVPRNKPFSPRAAGFGYVISNLAPPDPFHLLLARARQEATDMTWAQDVGGAKRLRVMANAWVLCCSAARKRRGGATHAGETELRFKGGEAAKEAEEGSQGPTPAR